MTTALYTLVHSMAENFYNWKKKTKQKDQAKQNY